MSADKIGAQHRARRAVLYVRQSSAHQIQHNREIQGSQPPETHSAGRLARVRRTCPTDRVPTCTTYLITVGAAWLSFTFFEKRINQRVRHR
jgi:hypothetical protein